MDERRTAACHDLKRLAIPEQAKVINRMLGHFDFYDNPSHDLGSDMGLLLFAYADEIANLYPEWGQYPERTIPEKWTIDEKHIHDKLIAHVKPNLVGAALSKQRLLVSLALYLYVAHAKDGATIPAAYRSQLLADMKDVYRASLAPGASKSCVFDTDFDGVYDCEDDYPLYHSFTKDIDKDGVPEEIDPGDSRAYRAPPLWQQLKPGQVKRIQVYSQVMQRNETVIQVRRQGKKIILELPLAFVLRQGPQQAEQAEQFETHWPIARKAVEQLINQELSAGVRVRILGKLQTALQKKDPRLDPATYILLGRKGHRDLPEIKRIIVDELYWPVELLTDQGRRAELLSKLMNRIRAGLGPEGGVALEKITGDYMEVGSVQPGRELLPDTREIKKNVLLAIGIVLNEPPREVAYYQAIARLSAAFVVHEENPAPPPEQVCRAERIDNDFWRMKPEARFAYQYRDRAWDRARNRDYYLGYMGHAPLWMMKDPMKHSQNFDPAVWRACKKKGIYDGNHSSHFNESDLDSHYNLSWPDTNLGTTYGYDMKASNVFVHDANDDDHYRSEDGDQVFIGGKKVSAEDPRVTKVLKKAGIDRPLTEVRSLAAKARNVRIVKQHSPVSPLLGSSILSCGALGCKRDAARLRDYSKAAKLLDSSSNDSIEALLEGFAEGSEDGLKLRDIVQGLRVFSQVRQIHRTMKRRFKAGKNPRNHRVRRLAGSLAKLIEEKTSVKLAPERILDIIQNADPETTEMLESMSLDNF